VYRLWRYGCDCGLCDMHARLHGPHEGARARAPTNLKQTLTGLPPWNNAGCNMDIEEQLDSIDPYPTAGAKNAWHPPSKQVRVELGARVPKPK